MKKSHCYLIKNLFLPLFDTSKGEKKKVLDGVLDGVLAVSSCHCFGSLCKKEVKRNCVIFDCTVRIPRSNGLNVSNFI
jgi:hypothetical protein